MNTRDEWLKQIEANPQDWQTVLIFADWLEEQGKELEAEKRRFWVQYNEGMKYSFTFEMMRQLKVATAINHPYREKERQWCKDNNAPAHTLRPRSNPQRQS
jgi:uncharacterized protein (TIGR02996 family)